MIGTTRSTAVTAPISSHASSTWSMSAMSAIEQPALRSGRITRWCVAGEHVGRLGHEVHSAEDDVGRLAVVRRELGELERVAHGVGPAEDFVTLVVVAEDQEPFAERGFGGCDAGNELVFRREGVVVRQRSL